MSNLVIAEMDATANEVKQVSVQSFPTLIFYPSNKKAGIDYDGERTEEGFVSWLQENTSRKVKWSEFNAEEEDEVISEVPSDAEDKHTDL